MKKTTLNKVILGISALLSIYAVSFLLINKVIKPEIHEPSRSQVSPYYTDIYPSVAPIWISNNLIAFTTNNRLNIFNVETRRNQVVPDRIQKLKVDDVGFDGKHIFTISEEVLSIINYQMNIIKIVKLPDNKMRDIVVNHPYLCISNQLTKTSPNDFGSTFTMYNLNKQPQSENIRIQLGKEMHQKKFLPSLKPLNCTQDNILLTTAFPQLLPQIFLWNPTSQSKPTQVDLPNLSSILKIEIAQDRKMAFIQNQDLDIFMVNMKNGDLTKIKQKDNSHVWAAGKQENIFSLRKGNIQYELFYESNESRKSLHKLKTPEKFIQIIPSPNQKNFILISQNGEMWILKLQK